MVGRGGGVRSHLILIVLLSAAGVTYAAEEAQASCQYPNLEAELAVASAVFVGKVTEVRNLDRWATVKVTETWKGDVSSKVQVRGGPPKAKGTYFSTDSSYKRGVRYLFVPSRRVSSSIFQDVCTNTQRFKLRLREVRRDVLNPVASASHSSSPPEPGPVSNISLRTVLGFGALAILLTLVLVIRKRHS